MPHAVWPRTPGRDYAGTWSRTGEWVGKEVWGSGGELGIRRDGTHGEWLVVPVDHLRAKPAAVTLLEAGAIGVPFITAWAGLEDAGESRKVTWSWCSAPTARSARRRSNSRPWPERA